MNEKPKSWIHSALAGKNSKGALHRALGVKKGEKIPKAKVAAAAKKPGKVGKEARLAQTLSKFKK